MDQVQKILFGSSETAFLAQLCGNIEQSVSQSVHLLRGLDQVPPFIYLQILPPTLTLNPPLIQQGSIGGYL